MGEGRDLRKVDSENITYCLVLMFLKIIFSRYDCWKYSAQVLGPEKLSWGRVI